MSIYWILRAFLQPEAFLLNSKDSHLSVSLLCLHPAIISSTPPPLSLLLSVYPLFSEPLQCKHSLLFSQEHSHYNVYNFFIIPPFTNYPQHMFPALDVINLSRNSLFAPFLRLSLRKGKAECADLLDWYGKSLSEIIGVLLGSAAPNCCVPQGPYEAIKQAISEDACAVTR